MVLMHCHNGSDYISDDKGFGMKSKQHIVFENQEVIMRCDSMSDIEWLKHNVPWPSRESPVYHKYPRAIKLDTVKEHDSGVYTCVGTSLDDDGKEQSMRSNTVLQVGGITMLWLDE